MRETSHRRLISTTTTSTTTAPLVALKTWLRKKSKRRGSERGKRKKLRNEGKGICYSYRGEGRYTGAKRRREKNLLSPSFFLKDSLERLRDFSGRHNSYADSLLSPLLLLAALASPSRDQVESIKRPSNRGDDDDEDFGEKRERMRERERERAI